ncbi:MAG: type 2 isopentenyl-diphosphate Delta-isomerase [Candidatus Dormibacteria bacterium]
MSRSVPRTSQRKAEHLRINLEEDVGSGLEAGFDQWRFTPRALPELDLAAVSVETDLFDRALQAPVLISCMTGGTPEAGAINESLARVAQSRGLALGLGSGRVLLEDPATRPTFDVRGLAPDVPLLANLGAVQLLRGVSPDECRRLVAMLRADALALHLNALQEALQPGGDATFAGMLTAIEQLCSVAEFPVVVKEVGWGIPPDDVGRLLQCGVHTIDVAGAGGTSWSEVERHRSGGRSAAVATAFRDWGLPTTEAIRRARVAAPTARLIASGGLRNGVDAAKAIALGADIVGFAGLFLRAAAVGVDRALELADEVTDGLRIAMFCTGSASLQALRSIDRLERVEGGRPAT